MKKIAVLCSGGDSPGMNCAVRAVVRTAIGLDLEVYGIKRGYSGLLQGDFQKMDASSVGNILQHGGTILQTSRCLDFLEADVRKEAANILKRKNIDGLIVIGGNGSFNGAYQLAQEQGVKLIGIPGTIDNDIEGTDNTIGFDTAVQTAVNAVDKIRDTAHSHDRTFIVEVMGRKSAAIALHVGVCTGAENIVLDPDNVDSSQICEDINRGLKRGKKSSIIVTAEGSTSGFAYNVKEKLENEKGIRAHVCILGHIQRGGNPTNHDRFMASKMGYKAVHALVGGADCEAIVYRQGQVTQAPLSECLNKKDEANPEYIELARALSI